MKQLSDDQVLEFNTQEEAVDFVNVRGEQDLWMKYPKKEVTIAYFDPEHGMPQELLAQIHPTTSKETIVKHFQRGGYFAFLEENGVDYFFPIREIALGSLFQRAGVGGFTMYNEVARPGLEVLGRQEKAGILTRFLQLYDGITKILVRDEKISFFASGAYSVLEERKLVSIILEYLEGEGGYPFYEFSEGAVSQTQLSLKFLMKEEDMELDMLHKLRTAKVPVSSVESSFLFRTSDVGELSASAIPYFILDGETCMPCGSPIRVKHVGSSTEKQFEEKIKAMFSSFQSGAKHFQSLAEQEILYPKNCFLRVAEEIHFPKTTVTAFLKEMEINNDEASNGFQIYWWLCQMSRFYAENNVAKAEQILNYEEATARALRLNFEKYDGEAGI